MVHSIPEHYTTAYTDGSDISGKCGAGLVIYKDGVTFHQAAFSLGLGPTIDQCELFAILQVALWLADLDLSCSTIYILSDYKTVLHKLCFHVISSKLLTQTKQALNTLARTHIVQLLWVPAHLGIQEMNKLTS